MKGWVQNKEKYVILDTETTGLESNAEIIEIAIINIDEHILFNSLIKPENPVPADAFDVHGISNEWYIK
jgi:DNA polymerase-3 subunit epsilon